MLNTHIRHIPPSLKLGAASILHRSNPVENQVGDDAEAGVGALEYQRPRRVFASLVPATDDEDEAGRDTALECERYVSAVFHLRVLGSL